ncbi:sugar ABC transporter ATP-binding protein [Dyadobacter sandarakinus]|uniref:Sugar ABC transporter ATP-binding protein n=1 Tax=Dyadobacter sandarakinus TaxID=2747268 RepID=A0ABX7I7P4_9BACT|nr:sugar ABC transporter ATP-binding protein [Dyadobacter sandarakinus]QRR02109.1 sugar ABC transporter ATP-binding protein [Dyadobacter sandarakinus]
MSDFILNVRQLSKSFSGVKALDQVQFDLKKGEVHALMGENGAGKSTFMKILVGLLAPDAGEIIFDGEAGISRKSRQRGISMIHQEMLIVPGLTVAQNIFLGREKEFTVGKMFRSWLDDAAMNRQAAQLLDQMGVAIAADAKMKDLSVAQMQMVEIAKAISNDARVMIMDEPTSAISDREVAILFRIIRELKAKGVGIIYISHKMDEIFRIADMVTVLRDGRYISTDPISVMDQAGLISRMVGREIGQMFPERSVNLGETRLSVRGLGKKGKFEGIDFQVRAGEILGLAGLMGAGRTEVARTIFGLDQPDEGEMEINGQICFLKTPKEAIARGIGYVSEDRKALGFVPKMSVRENLTLSSIHTHKKGFFINDKSEDETAARMIHELHIKASGQEQAVTYLSGGNQQKVVIGKMLLASPSILVLDEPTRGVDVGAKFEIYKLITQLAERGIAILIISSELPEILGLSDRIVVLSKGRQTALLSRQEATQELIMKWAVA